MSNPPNYLRMYRRKSPLSQGDIANLLRLGDKNSISRYESGQRKPAIEVLLVYHLFFDTSIEFFFEPLLRIITERLIERIPPYINILLEDKDDPKISLRIDYLKKVLTRLSTIKI